MVSSRSAGDDLTAVLMAVSDGDPEAMNQLLDCVYADLHRMCENRLAGRQNQGPIQPTELVHEVYLRLIDQTRVSWANRAHFFAVAARLIRRVLIDQIRASMRAKRGGGHQPVELTTQIAATDGGSVDLLALEEALVELAEINETAVSIIEMRFFASQTHDDIAHVLGLSERSVRRHWTFAKAWLYRRMFEVDT